MYKGKTFLAIVPARAGSKRLPRKNVLELAGKPLVAWTIEAALNSKFIDEVIVTTDDQEVYDIASGYGVKPPFIRPDFLSSDDATTIDVIKHCLEFYSANGKEYDFIVLLQPTSPLRNDADIDDSIKALHDKKADSIISVCESEHSPLWSNTIPGNGDMTGFLRDDIKNKCSQELPVYYRLNGAIYICLSSRLSEEGSFFLSSKSYSYEMAAMSSIDIDNQIDFEFTSYLISKIH